jgi:hypothetical protein
MPAEWDTMSYYNKWKYAMQAVTGWAYKSFTITESLLFKNREDRSMLKGIGTRLGETLR